MSVLIKGMKMPKRPSLCRFYSCDPLGVRKPYCDIKSVCNGFDDCPLVPVPPHGDLIDRNVLVDSLSRLCKRVCQYSEKQRKYMCGACPLGDAFPVVEDDAPAVIEAEEGEA